MKIQFPEGVTDKFDNAGYKPCLIILDDQLNEAYSGEVCKLFTKGSHDRNISVILITHNLFHQGNHCRTISLKGKYVVLLKNTRDKKQFTYLARQVYPKTARGYTKRTWRRPNSHTDNLCWTSRRIRRSATFSNAHISRRGTNRSLYTLVR